MATIRNSIMRGFGTFSILQTRDDGDGIDKHATLAVSSIKDASTSPPANKSFISVDLARLEKDGRAPSIAQTIELDAEDARDFAFALCPEIRLALEHAQKAFLGVHLNCEARQQARDAIEEALK